MESIVLKPGMLKWTLVLLVSLTFVVSGVWIAVKGDADIGDGDVKALLLSAAVFGGSAIAAALALLMNNRLEISGDSFSLRHLGRTYLYNWSECSEFRVWKMVIIEFVVFQTTNPKKRGLAWLDQKFARCNDGLPDTYGLPAKELTRLMNERRKAALSDQQS